MASAGPVKPHWPFHDSWLSLGMSDPSILLWLNFGSTLPSLNVFFWSYVPCYSLWLSEEKGSLGLAFTLMLIISEESNTCIWLESQHREQNKKLKPSTASIFLFLPPHTVHLHFKNVHRTLPYSSMLCSFHLIYLEIISILAYAKLLFKNF